MISNKPLLITLITFYGAIIQRLDCFAAHHGDLDHQSIDNEIIKENSKEILYKRSLLENSGENNAISDDLKLNDYYDKNTNTWLLDENTIKNILNYNIQLIVDQATENDIIMFNTKETIIPNETIKITKNLIFTSYIKDINSFLNDKNSNDIFPKANQKAIFSCSSNSAIFNIISSQVTIANIEISDCSSEEENWDISPIMFSNECENYKDEGTLKFHHVKFKNNVNYIMPSCFSAISPEMVICSSLDIIDVTFEDNYSANEIIIGQLLTITNMIGVDIINNGNIVIDDTTPVLMSIPVNSYLYIEDLNVSNNFGMIFSIYQTDLSIFNSIFENNNVNIENLIIPTATWLNISNSNVMIDNTLFLISESIFITVNGSKLEIRDSYFEDIKSIYTNDSINNAIKSHYSDINIYNTEFSFLDGGSKGSAIRAIDSNINITNSEFTNNKANNGSSIINICENREIEYCQLNLHSSIFSDNVASEYGGCVSINYHHNVTIINCLFENNIALSEDGGALYFNSENDKFIFLVSNSIFKNNSAGDDGGSFYIENRAPVLKNYTENSTYIEEDILSTNLSIYFSNVTIQNCNFEDNRSIKYAGVFEVQNADLFIFNSNFTNNTAGYGAGALKYSSLGSLGTLNILNCSFISNSASIVGGAMDITMFFQIKIMNTQFYNNRLSSGYGFGAGIYINAVGNLKIDEFASIILGPSAIQYKLYFQEKYGLNGVSDADLCPTGILEIKNTNFERNHAEYYGGAIYMNNGILVHMENCKFINNSATEIGGSSIYTRGCEIFGLRCNFTDNVSDNGKGGVLYIQDDYENTLVTFEGSNFIHNEAVNGGVIYSIGGMPSIYILENNTFEKNRAISGGGAIEIADRSKLYCNSSLFRSNEANEGKGGAINIEIKENDGFEFSFENCNFILNSAKNGGAMHVYTRNKNENLICETEACSNTLAMLLANVTFKSNVATNAGSVIMTNNFTMIGVDCHVTDNSLLYTDFENGQGFYPEKINAYNISLLKNNTICKSWTNNHIIERGYGDILAGYPLYYIIEIKHNEYLCYNDTESNYGYICNIENLTSGYELPPVTVTLYDELGQLPVESPGQDKISVSLNSSDVAVNSNLVYSLNEGNTTIYGISLIVEPRNIKIEILFLGNVFKDILLNVEVGICSIGDVFIRNGTICDSCDRIAYNFIPNNTECTSCPDNSDCTGKGIAPEIGYWHLSPCSTAVKKCVFFGACNYYNRTQELVSFFDDFQTCDLNSTYIKEYKEKLCIKGYTGPLCGSCEEGYGRMGAYECGECHKRIIVIIMAFLAIIFYTGISAFTIKGNLSVYDDMRNESLDHHLPETTIYRTVSRLRPIYSLEGSKRTLLNPSVVENYKRIASETIKVFVNYIQVTTIAISVNVAWVNYISIFLNILDFFGDMSSSTTYTSMDCILPNHSRLEKSLTRVIISIFQPFIILILMSQYWIIRKYRNKRDLFYLLKRLALTLLVVLYMSYINITKALIKILECTQVEIYEDIDQYSIYNAWIEDTEIQCYIKNHKIIATFFALPLILLFSIGFPVGNIVSLLYLRCKNKLESVTIKETMGFLYRAYKEYWIFWDSLIMLRKALLVAIVVFAYPLGGNQQGILCVFVLFISLSIHIFASPFKDEYKVLNMVESASLFVSNLTFTGGLLFNDDKTKTGLVFVIGMFIILSNLAFIIAMISIIMYYSYL